MNHDENKKIAEGSIAETNVERLLSRVYTPQSPEAPFTERGRAAMQATAAKEARTRGEPVHTAASESLWDRKQLSDRAVLSSWAVAGAIILGIFVIGRAFSPGDTDAPTTLTNGDPAISIDWKRDLPHLDGKPFITAADRPEGAAPEKVQIGQEIHTQRGERRRVVLSDGSVLYIDDETKLRLDDERRVTLNAGRIFVNVSPREESSADNAATFIVKTPDRQISALGTRFAVDVDEREDRVLVTQDKVKVDGLREEIHTGQQVTMGRGFIRAEDIRVTTAPRASHALAWTKDLMAAASASLVPESDFAGGALLVEHDGEKTRFTLRKYHVDVHIEDGFARTTIDQTYFNHLPERLEGTFYFPLPPDASISRLAMYVAGKRMEGGMLERNYAREVFESIKYRMQDPALLEWLDGSTFKMRVFPLEGRREKRIVLSYTQRLDSLYGRTSYRFPAGHNLGVVDEWTLKVHAKGHAEKPWTCRSHEVTTQRTGGDLTLVAKQTNTRLDRDVVIDLYDTGYQTQMAQPTAFSSTKHEGSQYLMLRHRPNLPTQQKRQRRDWVFLFESSGDRNPLLARAQIDVIHALLENAEHDDTFSIVTASTKLNRLTERQTATAANIAAAIAKLENTHLIGALDLAGALRGVRQITDPLVAEGNPHLVHIGSGVPIMGERDAAKLRATSHPASVVQLAAQCRAAGDESLADGLVNYVLAGVSEQDRLMTTLAAVRYYTAGKDDARAAKLVDGLLEDEQMARWASLWRLAATMADRLKKPAQALTFSERALELTYKPADEKIELEDLRRDYDTLMNRYLVAAQHLAKAKQHPPRRLVDRLVRAADRWRSLEVDVTAPYQRASQVLRILGENDLAWQYLTTPLATRPNEAQPWVDMALALQTEGDVDLADLAYTEAFNAKETNAQILWDHAAMLEAAGRKSQARELYV